VAPRLRGIHSSKLSLLAQQLAVEMPSVELGSKLLFKTHLQA